MSDIKDLIGKTLKEVRAENGGCEVIFITDTDDKYRLVHNQDCCESVTIEDICGDLSDLIGSPIIVADEVTGETAQPNNWKPGEYEESYTWTFYKFDTGKGGVTIRWFGRSNGCYSESVDFEKFN